MLSMIERASDRLASRFVKRIDAGACLPEMFCYCRPAACNRGDPNCHGSVYKTNCTGVCVYRGWC
jgi:hypothetical protein